MPTINRHLAIIQRITRKAGSEGIAVDSFLDFDGLRRKDRRRARDRRDSLTVEEAQQLLRHPVFTGCKSETRRRTPGPHIFRDALYWLPVLAVYTGARREELAAMEMRDVVQMDGICCLRLHPNTNRKRLKNTTSVRTVADALRSDRFLDYVATVPESGNLFPALKRKSKNAGLGADRGYLIDKIFEDQFGADRGTKSFRSRRPAASQSRARQGETVSVTQATSHWSSTVVATWTAAGGFGSRESSRWAAVPLPFPGYDCGSR